MDRGEDAGPRIRTVVQTMTGKRLDEAHWREDLYNFLSAHAVVCAVAEELQTAKPLAALVEALSHRVGRSVSAEELLIWLALGAAARSDGRPLLRPVVHAFVRGVPGAIDTFPDNEARPQLALSAEDEATDATTTSENPLIRLPVITCTTCGQHYFVHFLQDFGCGTKGLEGGLATLEGTHWPPLDEQLGGSRVVLLDRLVSDTEDEGDDDAAVPAAVPRHTQPVFLCRHCGALHPAPVERCAACGRPVRAVRLLAVEYSGRHPGWLTSCLSCGSLGREGGSRYREPARPVRAVTVSDVRRGKAEGAPQTRRLPQPTLAAPDPARPPAGVDHPRLFLPGR